MTFKSRLRVAALLAACGICAAGWADLAEADQPAPATPVQATAAADPTMAAATEGTSFSEAETALWLGDQLRLIGKPARLKYAFRKSGSLEEGFSDAIELDVTKVLADGKKNATVNFFTGARSHYVPPLEGIDGNPLLAVYLQGDVMEMNRLTGGNWRYFHRLIKHGLAERAEVTPIAVEFAGRKISARQIKIAPYVDDPKADDDEKYHRLKNKTYTFTVSDEIPGYIYEIRALVAPPKNAADTSTPLLDESMRLVTVEDVR